MSADHSLIALIWQGLLSQSGWEWLATGLGIVYVYLAAKQSLWCWAAAFSSTLIYTVLFWQGQLPMQAVLNFYYMAMALYGVWTWRAGNTPDTELQIQSLSLIQQAQIWGLGSLAVVLAGYYLHSSEQSLYPYLDAFVAVFSAINTYLMVKKYLQSWHYWLVINSAAITLYFLSGFYVTLALFAVYMVMAVYGLIEWRRSYQSQN